MHFDNKFVSGYLVDKMYFCLVSRQRNQTEGAQVGLLSNQGYRVVDDLGDDSLEVAVKLSGFFWCLYLKEWRKVT